MRCTTLAKIAHSAKKATTATAQMINSVNASLDIILMLVNLPAKIQKSPAYINNKV